MFLLAVKQFKVLDIEEVQTPLARSWDAFFRDQLESFWVSTPEARKCFRRI